MERRLLIVSNGHGEDEIAGRLIDALRAEAGAAAPDLVAWPMVGQGQGYELRAVPRIGPEGRLPSEGFSTLSLAHLARDLAGGWPGLLWRQYRFARSLRGRFPLLLGVGDIMPLFVAELSATPMAFVACAKSSHYGGAFDHNALERLMMRRRCVAVFPRDALTHERLVRLGVASRNLGNPMMDGLAPDDPAGLRAEAPLAVALLPGSRRDATDNALLLAAGADAALARGLPAGTRFLIAAHDAVDFARLAASLPAPWLRTIAPSGSRGEGAGHAAVMFSHPSGAALLAVKGRFADVLHASDIAVGMAGTANEQAVGLGLPLVAVPGRGNQGRAYVRMKMRFFGPAAVTAEPDPEAIGAVLAALAADPAQRARMAEAGRARMGRPGASRAIAREVLAAFQKELERQRP
ncbi:conserved hypothetical protein [Meinhardsimonia xiamenensis]|jgi:uncharacterized protein (TIGR03492 family)|uniref:Lipid-A-disaccharide synthase n=1 Tax=Meinhardsimonia xiamenensis TaxID=990712 RepID=A0A1G9FGT0_9RHOB|nr:lipid-A-disaccharide synthase-related protein [Meinhardsimonia xiamenensis]PRX37851.1 uncharacterized protein (TIGR03492 family) [Meinhardsimonia xiamenensis]SDK87635.1 conserved hypothetical protein [Meinhardsimonia xiamenensis]